MSDPIAELLKHEYGSIDLEDSDWSGMAKLIRQQLGRELLKRPSTWKTPAESHWGEGWNEGVKNVCDVIREVCQMEVQK